MSVDIPTTLQAFVNEELTTGEFASEADLVTAALETYRDMKRRHTELTGRLNQSFAQLDQGLAKEIDFEQMKTEVRQAGSEYSKSNA
ncbi:MAG: hypothetical protein AAFN77_19195 [Planctomycetota bacterium]